MTEPSVDPATVVTPAGQPLLEAAAWVGHSCWSELRLHEVLTGWMADETDAEFAEVLWTARADAAERAAAWHRRLPELREFPRDAFVVPPDPEASETYDGLAAARGDARKAGLRTALRERLDAYEAHQAVAVGPADGPVSLALTLAVDSVRAGIDRS